ncbi:type III secretion system inner membrane ring lipoprotein SctJ [Burkholderia ubonensis]|uniref:type III secretion system inner membrane ring lipoprotein SctJ n=1 Tax=Burkholderia ubonensis TaxID=101571 RepID=UPI0007524A57|nr:type III secretion inner membrane ring lipoprotein SctJ [Burkholderia ubonensis]KVC71764.1 type III secretion system protein [Burkholderia ubonensis]
MKRFVRFGILPIVCLLSACNQQALLHDLSESQANEVVAVLQAHDISVEKVNQGKSGYAVDVGQADFPAAVDLLQKYDLPSPPRVQIAQTFPSDSLVASPQAEQARLLSAIEQRLEQNLAAMHNVVSARVQVSYPLQQSDLARTEPHMHVSALITYRNDVDQAVLVGEVKRFIKNSFANIDYDDISVILYRAPAIFRAAATDIPSTSPTWLYGLLAIPALLASLAAGLWWRYRKRPDQPPLALLPNLRRGAQAASQPDEHGESTLAAESPPEDAEVEEPS